MAIVGKGAESPSEVKRWPGHFRRPDFDAQAFDGNSNMKNIFPEILSYHRLIVASLRN
jgi:hypothetical protein